MAITIIEASQLKTGQKFTIELRGDYDGTHPELQGETVTFEGYNGVPFLIDFSIEGVGYIRSKFSLVEAVICSNEIIFYTYDSKEEQFLFLLGSK
jgi:hypothetical protein